MTIDPHYGEGPVPPGAYAPKPARPGPPRQEDLASWGRRALAQLIDGAIVGGLTLALLAAMGVGFFADGEFGPAEALLMFTLGFVVFAALAFVYAPVVMARTNGQTLGKLAMRCRVVRADGRPVTFGWATMREVAVKGLLLGVAGAVSGGIVYVVDAIWPLVDGENRALHDHLVDSRVVRA